MDIQTRVVAEQPELRNADGKPSIEGYAAVFYRAGDATSEFRLWEGAVERIMPGAFDGQLGGDVRSLFNHDPNVVLGRTKSGTLKLAVDSKGLRYRVTPPDTQIVRDQVLEPIRRGDIDGASFQFRVTDQSWGREMRDGKPLEVRSVKGVKLIEVGPVTIPAYTGASSGLRADDLAEVRSGYDAWKRSQTDAENQQEAIKVRARAVEVAELESA